MRSDWATNLTNLACELALNFGVASLPEAMQLTSSTLSQLSTSPAIKSWNRNRENARKELGAVLQRIDSVVKAIQELGKRLGELFGR